MPDKPTSTRIEPRLLRRCLFALGEVELALRSSRRRGETEQVLAFTAEIRLLPSPEVLVAAREMVDEILLGQRDPDEPVIGALLEAAGALNDALSAGRSADAIIRLCEPEGAL